MRSRCARLPTTNNNSRKKKNTLFFVVQNTQCTLIVSFVQPKKKKTMKLESLANELLLHLFEFLDGTDILRAFHGLNSRFETLLVVPFQTYHLNFKSISKRDFELIYQQYLPLIRDRTLSLCFSDDHVTPNLPHLLCSNGLTLHQFTHLHSLAIISINSQDMLEKILQACSTFSYLTHLKISECSLPIYHDFSWLTNSVWRLPKLTHFNLHMLATSPIYRLEHNVNSSSLEYIVFNNVSIPASELSHILIYTSRLRYLHVATSSNYNERIHREQINSSLPLTILKVTSASSLRESINIWQRMPHLRHLTMDLTEVSENSPCDGHDWEQFIVVHLPELKTLQFRMMFSFSWCRDEEKVDELLNTFRTPFWLDERRWFVRCEYHKRRMYMGPIELNGSLYTLPYSFETYRNFNRETLFKSTCPHDEDHWLYTNVREISDVHQNFDWSLCRIRFPNIERLTIRLLTHADMWHVVPNLDHLTFLNIEQFDISALDQLQVIIDRAPCLYTLVIHKSPASLVALSKIISLSIRRIEWRNFTTMSNEIFNHDDCMTFVTSSLARPCEILDITVEKAVDMFYLIDTMSCLRSLICQCREDDGYYQPFNSIEPEPFQIREVDYFIKRLEKELPSTCSVRRIPTDCSRFEIWIR